VPAEAAPESAPAKVRAFGHTDVGKKRKENEDAFLVDEALGLFIVCDGMGGHAAGEVASNQATQSIRNAIKEQRPVLEAFRHSPVTQRERAEAVVEAAVQRACSDIYNLARNDVGKRGMGTTCVMMVVAGAKAVIGHVGDSRIYLLRQGALHRLTEDHTLVHQQMKAGLLTRDQAAGSPYKNVITRAVGIQESVQVDTLVLDLAPGDIYLLCSDGLHGYLPDDEVAMLLGSGKPETLPKRLADVANTRGGRDNITSIVVTVPGPPAQARDTAARMEALRRIPLFKHLTYKEQTAILAIATPRTFEKGDVVFREGDAGSELFIIIKGQVAVDKGGQSIAKLGPGGHFGEMAIIEQTGRSASVKVEEATTCLAVGRADLMALMRREQLMAVKLMWSFVQVLSDRLRDTNAALATTRSELAQASTHPFTITE
jgi:serine/threonine protein phosphatase PrpC